ncbi:MAG: N,N-dimethylformamidase [Alphaproteobacteria bacterium]|nr:N,N-dimethylformamidase [Alphaproteobacteria bacterium]
MHQLTGYVDRWSARAGERIRFMISSVEDRPYSLRFVRHLCADPNPDGPGYREIAMPTRLDGSRAGKFQAARPGSYGRIDALALTAPGGLRLAATIWPTLPSLGRQVVMGIDVAGVAIRLEISSHGGAALSVDTHRVEISASMLARRWYGIAATIDTANGTLLIEQKPLQPVGAIVDGGRQALRVKLPTIAGTGRVFIAAALHGNTAEAHYNGKIEQPRIAALDGIRLAEWDFSKGIATQRIVDIGPQSAHGLLVNLPTRAMTGSNWSGAIHDWKSAPEQYGAIHFHNDDMGECGWSESFALDVPNDWPSGFYAAHLSNGAGEDYIPFFVRPARGARKADVAFLVPTFSYQVYSSFVRPGRGAEIRERALSWGALLETPDLNPQFGLSTYNSHADGSGVAITSMLRPQLDTRPRQMSLMDPAPKGSGTGRINCDSYVIDWLDRAGIAHDVLTDHDLHEEGLAALEPYRVLICAQHPEYHSLRMMEALEQFLRRGGRLMYLGGNGFYWRAEPSIDAPHALEVRRAEGGIRVWATEVGESYHQFGGVYGGLWRRIGKPAHGLVGNGFSTQGRHLGFPYNFTEGIRDPRVRFMTAGIENAAAPGAVFGDSGVMGGGAAGFELDSADPRYGTPPNALVVAKGVVIHDDFRWVNEDMLIHRHPRPQEEWSCADMVFFETPAGGAVFSAGSMTYVGALPPDGYGNVCAKLTMNVVRRFMDPTPFA